ncbi:hypothetical protein A2797_02485 [candidate division WWE3 bacterium RIFCSPHIGHO2_01_FULL_48_15]|uniref:Aminoglycoside phosphotransferase domain-containing protein n=1 Tax=candidate division WWE3 bacterium RIFCSPHIGHO2_01_FULL_48_15 TaxID=1802619 RepID=A0A1F4VFQ9_UNCKA|nr:MAG: hypothetical protein A2797_02485 [candidate division WWE3 bacterium RIFCSPHIGHO2_01_FULL_48_15]
MLEQFLKQIEFEPEKYFRQGPRVFVAGGQFGGEKAIFKTSVEEELALTNQKLKREAIFLENSGTLGKFAPKLFKYGQFKGRFWYLVEWVSPGGNQSLGEGDFLIKNTFFTQENLRWALAVLSALRDLSLDIPNVLETELASTFYDLRDYRGLLEPQGKKFFGSKELKQVKKFLNGAGTLYRIANKTTITHHELYGSQILSSGSSFKLTDWENIGWGHPLRDFTTLWIRAFEHPAWQKKFLEGFQRGLKMGREEFEVLFCVEKILQNFGNLALFSQTKLPEEHRKKEKAIAFFRRCILETLT